MALSKYTNVDEINSRTTGTGQFLEEKDLFVISQNAEEGIVFGDCEYDIMEVILYDINNNILPQSENKLVRYIKYPTIYNYFVKTNTDEIAIDVNKILNEAGYKNGILKVNINFVRLKAGDETEFRKMWIQEISATRSEVRILPLIVQDDNQTTTANIKDFINLQELNVDGKIYQSHINNIVNNISSQQILENIKIDLRNRFPNIQNAYEEFTFILYSSFGLVVANKNAIDSFESKIQSVISDFKESLKNLNVQSSECETVNNSEEDEKIYQELLKQFNKKIQLKLLGTWIAFKEDISLEQTQETAFEAGKNVNTTTIVSDVDEYSTIDLTDIKLDSNTIDDFKTIQQKLRDRLNGTEVPTTEEPTDETNRTPVPTPTPAPTPTPPPTPNDRQAGIPESTLATSEPSPIIETIISTPAVGGIGAIANYEERTTDIGYSDFFDNKNNQFIDTSIRDVTGGDFN